MVVCMCVWWGEVMREWVVKDEARQKWAGDSLEALLQVCTAQRLPKSFKRMRNKLAS